MKKQFLTMDRRSLLKASAVTAAGLTLPAGLAHAAMPGGLLKISVNVTPNLLNPMLHRLNSEYLLGEMLYSGLTRLGPDMSAQPDLAESWKANDDVTEWRFTLRDNAKFHDGSKVTAADAAASLNKILDKKTGSPGRRNLGPIESISADGERVVVVKTSLPYGDLPVALTYTTAKVAPASIIENDFESLKQTPMGSGPFKLVSFEADRLAVLEKNPDYFIAGLPYLDRVEIITFPDAAGSTQSLLTGAVDIMMEVQPSDYKRVAASPGVEGLRTPSGRFIDVVMDNSRPPFNDKRVREALALTVDREAMIELVAEGYGTPGNDNPINSAYRYHSGGDAKKPDHAKAKALLAEAGYPDGLKIPLVCSVKPAYRETLAVVLREMARPGGFDIEIQTMDHSTYLDQVWKKGQFYVGFYNMQPTEDSVFKLLFTSDAAWNETKWNNGPFDALVEEARVTLDPAKRGELYAKAQALMREEVPALVPCFFDLLGARRDYVEDYDLHPRGAVFGMEKVWLAANAPGRG
jgi:peptide/nickel transport system substrate-binding protein